MDIEDIFRNRVKEREKKSQRAVTEEKENIPKPSKSIDIIKKVTLSSKVSRGLVKKNKVKQSLTLCKVTKENEGSENLKTQTEGKQSNSTCLTIAPTIASTETLNTLSKEMIDNDDFFNSRGKSGPRKKTTEGYNIYHQDELRIGLGGDTELCPFDCECCF